MTKKLVNLALQGGGAHGAFTWGALDRLLEEDRLEIEAISGTSAGAMNAAMLKTGYLDGGRDGARRQLGTFWRAVQNNTAQGAHPAVTWMTLFSPLAAEVLEGAIRTQTSFVRDTVTRTMSPYHWNPVDINPLRNLLEQMIDFDAVCQTCLPRLFISATNVRTGKIKVFHDYEMSMDAILASACLPNLFRAVEIGDDAYWDGGYMGNPALYPLFYEAASSDIMIVHVNPIERAEVPRSAEAIQNRINEISFNSSLMRELRAIEFVRRLIGEGKLERGAMKDVLIHSIRDDAIMAELDVTTKIAPPPALFDQLRDHGRRTADRFLRDNWGRIGKESSVDLRAMFA